MTQSHPARSASAVRIHCPVEPATFQALLAGRSDALSADPVLARTLAIIRGDNPLGDFGLYKGVVEIALGFESFLPTADARPVSGTAGAVSVSPTVILTTYLADDAPQDLASAALAQLVAAHPWETPVIEVCPTQLLVRP